MLGAIPRLCWNSSNRARPRDASRRMRMLHHSPTRSRLRAIGHCMLPKLLCRMGSHPSDLHVASYVGRDYHYASYFSSNGRSATEVTADLRSRMEASCILHELPKPTIAMINGPAAGPGSPLPSLATRGSPAPRPGW